MMRYKVYSMSTKRVLLMYIVQVHTYNINCNSISTSLTGVQKPNLLLLGLRAIQCSSLYMLIFEH